MKFISYASVTDSSHVKLVKFSAYFILLYSAVFYISITGDKYANIIQISNSEIRNEGASI